MKPSESATWIPLTLQGSEEDLFYVKRAKDEFLYDKEDTAFIDAISSWWTSIHGHCHPQIQAAIEKQIQHLDHVMLAGFLHDPVEKLSESLLSLTNHSFQKVFYSDNGSNAVEIALKLAIQYFKNADQNSQKNGFFIFSSAYHGDSIGAMNVSGLNYFNRIFSSLRFPTKEFQAPNCINCPLQKTPNSCNVECLDPFAEFLPTNSESFAAVIIEPLVFGANGMIFYEPKFLERLQTLCKTHDILLIYDEVFTGMGRLGNGFAYQETQTCPDLLVTAKGLTGGALPLAATLVSHSIYQRFLNKDPYLSFFHAHTMTGNPISCSASLASVGLWKDGGKKRVKQLESNLKEIKSELVSLFPDLVLHARVKGSLFAFDLPMEIGEDEYLNPVGKRFKEKAFQKQVLLRPLGNTIYVCPPYTTSKQSLLQIQEALAFALKSL
nr:adenosylmethionine--8-amino-7-oxononanoate transaminase [Leptospira ryugenii]